MWASSIVMCNHSRRVSYHFRAAANDAQKTEFSTRHKYKDVMGVVYKFAQSEGLLPLGEQFNPVS
jgi:hypothetical protein